MEKRQIVFIKFLSIVFSLISFIILISILFFRSSHTSISFPIFGTLPIPVQGLCAALFAAIAFGLWKFKDWSRTVVIIVSIITISALAISEIFKFSTLVFSGEKITPIFIIFSTLLDTSLDFILKSSIPFILIISLRKFDEVFSESQKQRFIIDMMVRKLLLIIASTSVLIVGLIFLFTFIESTDAIYQIGLGDLLTGTIWRPGAIIGDTEGQFGLIPMILGSIYSTLGAILLGVPLSIFTAIFLAEIAPPLIRDLFRPAVELLAGIPSVIFGLFGMIVLAPLIRNFEVAGNSGFGILNASIILAIMILPTITNVAEDAIRAVPDSYRHAALAMGATRWQTIITIVLPAARSGIVAAIILGIGRALGETMALIMVIGNSIAIPTPLDGNPLTLLLATARTLTGNIAVEINYAAGVHRSALFFTGVLLFLLLLIINRIAHFILKERKIS